LSLFPDWSYFWNLQIPQKFATVPKTFLDMSKTFKHSFDNFLLQNFLGFFPKENYSFWPQKKETFWPKKIGWMTQYFDLKLPTTQKH